MNAAGAMPGFGASRPGVWFRSSNILAAMERGIDYSASIGDEVRSTACIPTR